MKSKLSTNGLQPVTGKVFLRSNYHSLKNQKSENHVKPGESLTPEALVKVEWQVYELQCTKKIQINERNIAQFRENTDKISANLKTRYEAKIAQLEKKNVDLRLKVENFRIHRSKEQTAFNTRQHADLKNFKTEFNGEMDKLI